MKISKVAVGISILLTMTNSQAFEDGGLNDDLFSEELPMVLSATRLRQSQLETPASVTIIDRDLIRSTGARNIVELLRLVPGMSVGYVRGNTPEVSLHGLHTDFSRRIQVLVDGRSIFKPGLSRVLWGSLPISVDDIERIEVVRGPNTASYGANSFLGVVNIITRHPSDVESNQLSATLGNKDIRDGSVRVTKQSSEFSYRLTFGHRQDEGFDGQFEGIDRLDAHDTRYLRADFAYNPSLNDQWRFTVGYSDSDEEQDLLDVYQVLPAHIKNTQDSFAQINWNHQFSDNHEFTVNGHYSFNDITENWQTCPPAIFMSNELGTLYDLDSDYTEALIASLSSGNPPPQPPSAEIGLAAQHVFNRFLQLGTQINCGTANQNFDESKWEIEFQDTYTFNNNFRIVSGFSIRHDTISGESFFEGRPTNDIQRLFTNVEWKLNNYWLLNFGAMYEHDDYIGGEFSPRLAINYIEGQKSAWRFVLAKGTRTPDFYEQLGHRQYRVRDLEFPINGTDNFAIFYQTPRSSGRLDSETIVSREIGWFYHPTSNINFDIKIFYDDLENVIDGLFGLGEFNPQNAVDYANKGLDLQLDYFWNENNRLWLSYSYLDVVPKKGRSLEHEAAKQTLSALYHYTINHNSRFSAAFYLQDIGLRPDFKRLDARYSHNIELQDSELNLELVVQYNINDQFFFDRKSVFDSKLATYLRLRYDF